MLQAIKNEVFERLAKEIVDMHVAARECRIHGFESEAEATHQQILGVYNAIDALGFELEEFRNYYKENRARIRKEVIDEAIEKRA